ncbi:hypothetical protein A3F29_04665 [Candidatus Roizmanbacteria bacterium RIFCSPHIGHO2_12_FULL_33_9]|uniref:Membrane protein insertion efficiency factor YidD n=1 Tax=Candidatus Roizmanbacteria bacterium RIFCSPHIGHO2_12_FULL_33_9 TaxID=1802045 RepID=A0A1F7HJ31_9BACT|nr:MAG: hypothetical protein A3F29_04665 [Candidatus Roizmanbacteria bacterium RIFCSPHIGHO2_12_FULL_33_9]
MKKIVLFCIRVYQRSAFIRKPFVRTIFGTGGSCRFKPTCSEYTYQSINKFGVLKGISMGIKQFLKCRPFSKG